MALRIGTFDNTSGGNTLYKALTHPRAAEAARRLLQALAEQGPVAVYDPNGSAEGFAAIYGLSGIDLAGVYVQEVARIGSRVLDRVAQPVSELGRTAASIIFVTAFEAEQVMTQLQPVRPARSASRAPPPPGRRAARADD